jgi:hypothetical protein
MTRAAFKSRRRAVRAVEKVHHDVTSSSLMHTMSRIALSRPARAAYIAVGTVGLAALAVALIGPKRIEREVLKPLRGAIEPQAEKLWADSRPLRQQIAGLFQSATPSGRERLVRIFQSWIGHFHATLGMTRFRNPERSCRTSSPGAYRLIRLRRGGRCSRP